jgi:hypothetical protein
MSIRTLRPNQFGMPISLICHGALGHGHAGKGDNL